jgi:hypothetical protein
MENNKRDCPVPPPHAADKSTSTSEKRSSERLVSRPLGQHSPRSILFPLQLQSLNQKTNFPADENYESLWYYIYIHPFVGENWFKVR